MLSLHEAALAYAGLGWSVFPIEPGTKNPYKGTHGFHDATTDLDVITAWWTAAPDAWPALWCRGSGVIAIDVDPRNGGTETLASLEAAHGPLPRDTVQQSGSGGLHILCADPSPGPAGWTRNADAGGGVRGKAGPGIDIKCNGYILLEPAGKYRWLALGAVPPMPAAWVELIRKPLPETGVAPVGGLDLWATSSDEAPLPAADRERLRADLRALGPRASGKGTTFAAILRVFHDFGLSVDDGYPILCEWNAACGQPHDEHELHRQVRNIAESGRATGMRGNRRSDLSRLQRVVRAAVDHRDVRMLPTVAESDDAEDEEPPHATVVATPSLPVVDVTPEPVHPDARFAAELERAAEDVLRALDSEATPVAQIRPMFETADTLLARRFPPAPWLVEGLLPRDGTHGVAGEAKTTKSWMATEMALSIVSATPAFGKFRVAKPGRVAYFYAEDVGPSVQTRIRALTVGRKGMAAGWGSRLIVQPRGRVIDLTRDIDLVTIIASVRMFGDVDMVVLDPLRDMHSGEEDSSDAMRLVMSRMRVIGIVLGCAVMFVHHSAKASADVNKRRGGQRMRGSGAIHGSLDCGLYLWDLRGNGQTEFINAVESEVKLARSAGVFDLKLNIVDNKHGTAERATWAVMDRVPDKDKKDADAGGVTIGDVLVVMFDHGTPMVERSIALKLKGAKPAMITAAVATAAREGLISRAMAGTTPLGWALTPKGLAVVRDGATPAMPPTPTPTPHPATAAICNVPAEGAR